MNPSEEVATRVLVVDDEPDVCEVLVDLLESNGLQADAVHDGAAMHQALAQRPYTLVLLDLRLKREDGLALARALRHSSDVPIIILTGKGDETDRILGLELVADDYMTKPFNPRELLARARALIRRSRLLESRAAKFGPEAKTPAGEVHFGDFMLDLEKRALMKSNGENCRLSPNEYQLLEALATQPNVVLSRDQLLERMQRQYSDVFDRAIDIIVLRLRRKIEKNPAQPEFIRTERGSGYLFCLPGAAE